jgi:hypothetical protein
MSPVAAAVFSFEGQLSLTSVTRCRAAPLQEPAAACVLVVNAIETENAIVARIPKEKDRIKPFSTKTARAWPVDSPPHHTDVAGSSRQVQSVASRRSSQRSARAEIQNSFREM